jgi:DNA uptake protein ComE-like DNA-binding protein
LSLGLLAAKVDLNTASYSELETARSDEKQARDILEYREYVSIFSSLFDLRQIPSIDQSTLLRIKDQVGGLPLSGN